MGGDWGPPDYALARRDTVAISSSGCDRQACGTTGAPCARRCRSWNPLRTVKATDLQYLQVQWTVPWHSETAALNKLWYYTWSIHANLLYRDILCDVLYIGLTLSKVYLMIGRSPQHPNGYCPHFFIPTLSMYALIYTYTKLNRDKSVILCCIIYIMLVIDNISVISYIYIIYN